MTVGVIPKLLTLNLCRMAVLLVGNLPRPCRFSVTAHRRAALHTLSAGQPSKLTQIRQPARRIVSRELVRFELDRGGLSLAAVGEAG
jgi:hypothetical protein